MSAPSRFTLASLSRAFIGLLRAHPVLLLPFALSVAVDLSVLALILLAPQYPFSLVLAPMVRAFWGEQFLHYPANLFLAPKLFTYARYAVNLTFGIVLTGVAVTLIAQANSRETPDVWTGFSRAFRRYLRMAVVWAMTFAVLYLAIKVPSVIPVVSSVPLMVFALKMLISLGVQALFICAVPSIMVENKKVFASLVRSLALFRRYWFILSAGVILPGLLFLPVSLLTARLPLLVDRFDPEAVIGVVLLRIIVTAIVDLCVTGIAVLVLLRHREEHNERISA